MTPSEQRICISIGLCIVVMVLSGVSLIYLTVFKYMPAHKALTAGIMPQTVVCRTVQADLAIPAKGPVSKWYEK